VFYGLIWGTDLALASKVRGKPQETYQDSQFLGCNLNLGAPTYKAGRCAFNCDHLKVILGIDMNNFALCPTLDYFCKKQLNIFVLTNCSYLVVKEGL
jgi:hypothetical protein